MSAKDLCFHKQGNMLSFEQAIEELLAQATAVTESEQVDLATASGRVLAEDMASPIDVPGFDNSAMDGYALHSSDFATAWKTGLPGNPVSVFVTFLHAMQGRKHAGPRRYPVRASFDYHAKQRREYVRVRLHADEDGVPIAETFPRQGPDVLSAVAWADGLAEIQEDSTEHACETVSFLPFEEWSR
jgi:molybdopterin biosynthesis enzyme